MKRIFIPLLLIKLLSLSLLANNFEDSFENEYQIKEEKKDYLFFYNEWMTSFNDYTYTIILDPISKGYQFIVPEIPRTMVDNFFDNLSYPINLANNILQLKFENALTETERFLINSTFGILGLSDSATLDFNIPKNKEDFGQTLGFYGISSGQHIVLPILGPSNTRDIVGKIGDILFNPISYLNYNEQTIANGIKTTNELSTYMDNYALLKSNAIELYPYLKNSYEQYREKQILK